jgi:hypothetical protein
MTIMEWTIHPKRNKKIFPNNALIEIPSNHILFQNLSFSSGLPKIHEHGKRPQAYGIFVENRLVLLYTFECDLAMVGKILRFIMIRCGTRKALKMGANIISYIFNN